jgi:hypothetical protein
MDWKRLSQQAKQIVDKRGGPESLKEDAEELRDIAESRGTTSEKLKEAAQAIREPGAHHEQVANEPAPQVPPREPAPQVPPREPAPQVPPREPAP